MEPVTLRRLFSQQSERAANAFCGSTAGLDPAWDAEYGPSSCLVHILVVVLLLAYTLFATLVALFRLWLRQRALDMLAVTSANHEQQRQRRRAQANSGTVSWWQSHSTGSLFFLVTIYAAGLVRGLIPIITIGIYSSDSSADSAHPFSPALIFSGVVTSFSVLAQVSLLKWEEYLNTRRRPRPISQPRSRASSASIVDGSVLGWSATAVGLWPLLLVIDLLSLGVVITAVGNPNPEDGVWPASSSGPLLALFIVGFALDLTLVSLTAAVQIIAMRRKQLSGYQAIGAASREAGINGDQDDDEDDDESDHPEGAEQSSASDGGKPKTQGGWKKSLHLVVDLVKMVWPSTSFVLQFHVFLCFLCLGGGRVVNLFVPNQFKVLVDSLTTTDGQTPSFVWAAIIVYVFLRLMQGSTNILSNQFWIPVGQWVTKRLQVLMFSHLHSLSLRFHLARKTGEVLRVMDRGTSSIDSLLSALLFNIVPTILDVVIAIVYFIVQFDVFIALIVLGTMVGYVVATVTITEWRIKFRKETIDLDNKSRQRAVDSLLNFETVKYYGNERFELDAFSQMIDKFNRADYLSSSTLNVLNFCQTLCIHLGLLAGCLLCGWRIANNDGFSVGDFVLFITYITQLYTPLNMLGTYYRMIQQNLVDMSQMFDLLHENIEIQDSPDAKPLVISQGEVAFDNVSFTYPNGNQALKNVSFSVRSGQTVAIVGPSGGGKTSLLRLLFRFFDVTSGAILIDGQDIRNVTIQSLRNSLGVVPQDTVLFNDTILYNIRYGRLSATEEEVIRAAQAAQIHDKILTFQEGYETKVGERGLRLSGGEKQRVAIARTILKNPPITILDEATSALDTETERNIQKSLMDLCADRTTLVVAHRLSTIIHADLILVLKNGTIAESGSHAALLEKKGIYFEMWSKQLESAAEAKVAAAASADGSKKEN